MTDVTTNESRCLLRHVCRKAGDPDACLPHCAAHIQLHGLTGDGGRAASANVPAEYRLRTLADIDDFSAARMIRKYASTFARQYDIDGTTVPADRIKSLYLWSAEPGTGKTTTAAALVNEWLIANAVGAWRRDRQPTRMPAYFLDVNAWQTDYNGFNRPRVPEDVAATASERYYTSMERAKSAPFAVLDDIGVRNDVTDGFRGDLHSVVNYRVTNRLPTVYTSNLPLAELPRVFGEERLADRMRDMCVEIEFTGGSRRGMRR